MRKMNINLSSDIAIIFHFRWKYTCIDSTENLSILKFVIELRFSMKKKSSYFSLKLGQIPLLILCAFVTMRLFCA